MISCIFSNFLLRSSFPDDVFESDSATLTTHHVRQKRNAANSMSNHEYTIEVLVGVDRKMIEYHGDGINSYVLTLMSIVSSIFADASIGNLINVAVVHILIVKHDLVPDANGIGEWCELKFKGIVEIFIAQIPVGYWCERGTHSRIVNESIFLNISTRSML
jgi:hypothetical protein